jgi:hypothetical protein
VIAWGVNRVRKSDPGYAQLLAFGLYFEVLAHDLAAGLHVAVREAFHIGDAHCVLQRLHVELGSHRRVDPHVGRDPFAVALRDLDVHLLDLAEDVEIGREPRDGTVEEHHVLHEEHELLRCTGAVRQQLLRELL